MPKTTSKTAATKTAAPKLKTTKPKTAKPKIAAKKSPAAPPKKAKPPKTPTKPAVKPTAKPKASSKKPTAPTPVATGIYALVTQLQKTLDQNKAEDIVTIDLMGRSSLADYMIIASGRSARQVAALAGYVEQELRKATKPTAGHNQKVRVEGQSQGDWVILDNGDVVVHLFRPEVREFYQLEKLWEDDQAPATKKRNLK